MWYQFLLENFHFAVNLFAALSLFSVFWLYFDAWSERKTVKETFKILGFLLLSLSFLSHAVLIESPTLSFSLVNSGLAEEISEILKISGYLFLIIGLVIDPLMPKPKLNALTLLNFSLASYFISPVLAIIIAWLYLRRATIGLEKHTKEISLAFFLISFYEVLTIPVLFADNSNVDIFNLVTPLGPIWIASHVILLFGSLILITWAFSYLLKRINTQLFIIFTTVILSIFLVTTVSFTFLLLKNLSDETLTRLKTDVLVLSFALDTKKSEAIAAASILAQNSKVAEAITENDRDSLSTLTEELLLSKNLTSVVVLNESGQVLARGEDEERYGDSMSDNLLVKRALIGESLSSLDTQEAAMAPVMLVRALVPIEEEENVIGAVMATLALDNNFLDGVKEITELEVGIFSDDTLSATTISDLNDSNRPIGIQESNKDVKDLVLNKGEDYSQLTSILNVSYFAVYSPLKDVNNEIVGMLLVGKPSSSIFTTAGKSIELTFLGTVILIILSVFPSFYVSKYIANQLR